MSELILLGAGASVEADVPDTYGMTQKILTLFPMMANCTRSTSNSSIASSAQRS